MILQTKTVLPYSLLYISDAKGGDDPEPDGAVIISTASCILVSCVTFSDGPTEMILGTFTELNKTDSPAFDAPLEVPSREIVLSTAEHERLLSAEVPEPEVRVRIWLNRSIEPDIVAVGLG